MFNYKIEPGSSSGQNDEPILKSLGQEGWELVAVTIEKGDGIGAKRRIYFFKKEIIGN